jgi:hypothetical protein
LAKSRQPQAGQIPKNHVFRIGPPTATHRIAQQFQMEFGCLRF